MRTFWFLSSFLLFVLVPGSPLVSAQSPSDYASPIAGSTVHTYKSIEAVHLELYFFQAEGAGPHPCIVLFYGGGWRSGSPTQFAPQARYLRSRGMSVALADYRVSSRHGTSPVDATRDAKSAVRWLRSNAKNLGIDQDRLAAGGGSAGGHLAAATAVVPGLDEAGEDLTVSSVPNALLLFNPALDLSQLPVRFGLMGDDRLKISPQNHVRAGLAPVIIFHGTADEVVPHDSAEAFRDAMQQAGNRVELVSYAGRGHGFFNHGRSGGAARPGDDFEDTLERSDRFLTSLGFLKGEPAVKDFSFEKDRSRD